MFKCFKLKTLKFKCGPHSRDHVWSTVCPRVVTKRHGVPTVHAAPGAGHAPGWRGEQRAIYAATVRATDVLELSSGNVLELSSGNPYHAG